MINKIFQVFVSSTYEDLRDERKKVQETLINNNCLPRGMELFNASDKSQWKIITDVIDDCDYFVLIIGGKYGSIDESVNKSYTQKEFEYAKKKKIPIFAFVRKNVDNLPAIKVERDRERIEMLKAFTDEVKNNRLVNFWEDEADLALKLYKSIEEAKVKLPRIGFVRSDEIPAKFFDKEITTTIDVTGMWTSVWEETEKDLKSIISSREEIKFIQKGNQIVGQSEIKGKYPRKFRHEGWIYHNIYFGEFFELTKRKGATNGRGNCLLKINENCDRMEGTCSWYDIDTKKVSTSEYVLKLKNNS